MHPAGHVGISIVQGMQTMIQKHEARARLAHNVRRIRKELNLTQVQLSERSGMHQSTISELEKAAVLPNPADLYNLAEALNSSIDVLLREFEPSLSTRP